MNDQQQNKSSSLEVLMPIQKQLSEKVKKLQKTGVWETYNRVHQVIQSIKHNFGS